MNKTNDTGMFRNNIEALHPMPINDVIKLISGLRLMLGKALLLEESIVPKDIEIFIKKYFTCALGLCIYEIEASFSVCYYEN